MKALILAAGLGTRLAPITDDRPKSLVPVNNKPILVKQIENLYKNGIEDIYIVSGYKSEVLEEVIYKLWPSITIIKSIDYAVTNNMYSAYLGLRTMFPNGINETFLMMNADVFFDSTIITSLINDVSQNAIAVDIGRYIEESMKVIEKDGRLVEISKTIPVEDALGCSIDVYKFSISGGNAFYNQCVKYIEMQNKLNLWSEVALNDALKETVFTATPVCGRWVEIDNHDDLADAEILFSEND